MPAVTPPEERFWRYVTKGEPDECWLWRGGRMKGYGSFFLEVDGGRTSGAHRASHILFIGPIPEGYEVDHLCKVTLCVNPRHLEAVTRDENRRRSDAISERNRAKTHCPAGHAYDEANTHFEKVPSGLGRRCRKCHAIRERARRARIGHGAMRRKVA